MHEYMTRRMIAQQPITYAEWPLKPGDSFLATPDDAAYLTRSGKAREADPAPKIMQPPEVKIPESKMPEKAERPVNSENETQKETVYPVSTESGEPIVRRRGRPPNSERNIIQGEPSDSEP